MQAATPVLAASPAPVQTPAPAVNDTCYTNLLQQYDWDWHVMLAIEKTESTCNAAAVSPPDWDGIRDYGAMQLHGQAIFDPAANIAEAYQIWSRQGYHAWSSYNSGAYLKNE